MMASLPQTPAQTGAAAILAVLGQAAAVGNASSEPGFEQLLANVPATTAAGTAAPVVSALPSPTATPSMPVAANPFGVQTAGQPAPQATMPIVSETPDAAPARPARPTTPPAAALFGLAQPIADAPVDTALSAEPAVRTPARPGDTQPVDDAAAAASLLIAIATPLKNGAPACDKPAPTMRAGDDTPAVGEAERSEAAAAAVIVVEPTAATETPVAVTVAAAAIPVADKPVAERAAKPAAPTGLHRPAEAAPQTLMPVRVAEAAPSQPAVPASAAPATAKPVLDAGASMTVLFAQPDLQGAAPLAEAAKPAPVAERVLDMSSDDQWIAQLAADIAATKSDKGDISFRLMPRHLGRLDVSMLTGDAGVTVRLDTQHEATATIVQAAQPRLVEDLRQQGVRVADAQVTHTPAEAGRQQQQPQGQGRQAAPDASHLIETAPERPGADSEDRAADRRGRFA